MTGELGPRAFERRGAFYRRHALDHAPLAEADTDRRAVDQHAVTGSDLDPAGQLDMRAQEFVAMFDFDPAHNPVAFPSPRSWEFAHRALAKFGERPELLLGSLEACVGPAAGVELKAFIDNLDNLPDIDAIIQGTSTSVPKEIDLQYAVAAALVGRAIRAKGSADEATVFGHILDYAGRFPSLSPVASTRSIWPVSCRGQASPFSAAG